jgi:hypothetical protein
MTTPTMLRMGQAQFGVPIGTPATKGKFLGTEVSEPKPGSTYGPGREWRFELTEGPFAGRVVSRTTAFDPTLRNSCGKLFTALIGGNVPIGTEVNIDDFIGHRYLIMFEPNSVGTAARVASVSKIANDGQPVVAPANLNGTAATPTTPTTPAAPPPRPNRRANTPATLNPAEQFWSCLTDADNEEPVLRDRKTLQDFIAANHINPSEFTVCPADGSGWEPASKFNFSDVVPW